MSVSAAAIIPPVQDSAVASITPRARQRSSTLSARRRSASSAKEIPRDQQQHERSIDRREDVVDHDAEAADDAPVGPADRPRLPDVEQAKQHEPRGVDRTRIERRRRQASAIAPPPRRRRRCAGPCRGAASRRDAAHQPSRNSTAAATSKPAAAEPRTMSQANGKATSEPKVPGARGATADAGKRRDQHRRVAERQRRAGVRHRRVTTAGAASRPRSRRCPRRGR